MSWFNDISKKIKKQFTTSSNNTKNNSTFNNSAIDTITGKSNWSTESPTQFNYQLKPQDQWTAPEYCAFGRKTGNSMVFQNLNTMSDQRGSRFWNLYRGGRATLPTGCKEFFRDNYGYEGPFDQQFCNEFNSIYGNSVDFTKTLGVATPSKKSSKEEWAGWYVTQIQDNLIENEELNRQYGEYRKSLNSFYDQFVKVNGRAPTYEEFEASVDRSKYSKLKTIDDSIRYATKLQILPTGTYYSADTLPGLYYAKQNGEDINTDRDYFDDAVKYAMNPVQKSQSAQKYIWSNDDLTQTSPEDQQKYLKKLSSEGNYEEAEAFKYACWAARPHDDGVVAAPSALDSNYGYYHDEQWFERTMSALGDEYDKRLNYDGTMDNPGKSGDYMDQTCYELYNIQKNRDKTKTVEDQFNGFKPIIQDIFRASAESGEGYEDFSRHVGDELEEYLNENKELKAYLDKGYDPKQYCRDLHISSDSIGAMTKRVWNGQDISKNIDYAAAANAEGYEPPFAHEKPSEIPLFYAADQRRQAQQRLLDRNNAEESVTQAVTDLAESGAMISKGAIPAMNGTFVSLADINGEGSGLLGKLWSDVFGVKHSEKLGTDFTPAEAAAVDPVLGQFDVKAMPEVMTTSDILKLANAKVMSRVNDDNICLADGIVNYALPGTEHLHRILMDRALGTEKAFNALTYRNVYNDRIEAGANEAAAANIAVFAATDLNAAVESIGNRYDGDKMLVDASQRLLNDMAQEDGSKDSYDMFIAVNDDVHGVLAGQEEKADSIMGRMLPAFMLGSSEAATPGFRAETNAIIHDITTGTISPQDIVDALDPTSQAIARTEDDEEITLSNGVVMTGAQYKEAADELSNFSPSMDFSTMSDNAKAVVGYDALVEKARAAYSDDPNMANMVVEEAIDATLHPDNILHTTPAMEGATDFIGKLSELASSKSEHDVNVNLANTRQSWLEQNVLKRDLTGFASAVASFFGGEQSDAGDMIDLMRSYGKFFSGDEMDAAWEAFSSGQASYDEIKALVDERVGSVDGSVVNAMNNQQAMEKSYAALDRGMEQSRNNVNTFELPEGMDPNDIPNVPNMVSQVTPYAGDAFTGRSQQEVDAMEKTLEQYKALGVNGVYLSYLDADNLKKLYGIDLKDTNFKTGADVLTAISPEWETPYTTNPGYTYGVLEAVGKGMAEGYREVMKIPALLNNFLGRVSYAIAGEEYNPETAFDPFGLNKQYVEYKKQEEQTVAMQQNVATRAQAFLEQGTSEVVRNTVSSGIGAMLGEAYAVGEAARMTGMPLAFENVAAAGDVLQKATTIVSRAPFATSVYLNEFDKQMQEGASVLKGIARATISAGIELGTEDLPFEKLYSFRSGGFSLGEHAANAAGTLGGRAVNWVNNSVKNILSEIGEEEASEFLGRIVDTGEAVLKGDSFNDAIEASFAGYDEAAAQTALATAFTTTIFSAIDLGGITADYLRESMANNQEVSVDRLMTAVQADILANADEDSDSSIPTIKYTPYSEQPARESNTEYNPATTVPYFKKETAVPYDRAANVPFFGKKGEAANAELTDAVKNYMREAAKAPVGRDVEATTEAETETAEEAKVTPNLDELAKEIGVKATALMNAMAEDRAEAEQEALEAASEQEQENPQEESEESQETAIPLPDSVQRVVDYVDHAETAIDNAIIEKGVEMEVEKAVAEDAGLQAKQVAIDAIAGKIEEGRQRIAGMQQQVQTIQGQLAQALRAAMDEGLDTNSEQAVNVTFQKRQQQSAVESDISQQQEKQNTLTREAEEAQKAMEDEKERIAEEAKEKATKDYTKRIEDARAKLFEQGGTEDLLKEMDADAERDLNSIRARQGGYQVNSQFTIEEDKANQAAVADEQQAKTGLYADQLPSERGIGATERYVDPANYRQKSVVTERRDSEWQDEAKHRQDRMNENVQEERRNRMRNDFDTWRETNYPVTYVPIDARTYIYLQKAISNDASTDLLDNRYLKTKSSDADGSAPVYSQTVRGRGFSVKFDRDDRGYSENPEDVGIYHAGDFLNDDGSVTGLGYKVIAAVDPEIANRARVMNGKGGTDAVLNHITENNRYLVLGTPAQDRAYTEDHATDSDRYTMLTRDGGLSAYERTASNARKVVEGYYEKLRGINDKMDRLSAVMKDPSADTVQASIDYKEASERQKQLYRGLYAAQATAEKADQSLAEAQEFLIQYKAGGGKQYEGKTFYVIDKSAVEDAKTSSELYREAIIRTADRISENAFLSDEGIISLLKADYAEGDEAVEDVIDKRFGSMSHEELGAALFDHFFQQELDKAYADQYKGAVEVIRGDNDESVDKKLGQFVRGHGGYSRDGFGGEGFANFNIPSYYSQQTAHFASEEAILKFLPESMYQGLVKKPNGETEDFKATSAQYNVNLQTAVQQYAASKGLSEGDADALIGMYRVRNEQPRTIGKNTIVAKDDQHFFGVPTKNVDDASTNKYLRDNDGSYSVSLAKYWLNEKLKELVRADDEYNLGQRSKPINTDWNSIEVDFIDDAGKLHKKVKVGEYYDWWEYGGKFFPSFDQLMENCDKIVCNFYVQRGKNNKDSKVNFVLKQNNERDIDLERDIDSINQEGVRSDLAWTRGHQELADELHQVQKEIQSYTDDPDLVENGILTEYHAKYNVIKNELHTALEKAKSCSPDKLEFYQDAAAKLYAKMNALGEVIMSRENGVANKVQRSDAELIAGYQSGVPSVELKATEEELAKAMKSPAGPTRDKRVAELQDKIAKLRDKAEAYEQEHPTKLIQEEGLAELRKNRPSIPPTAKGRYEKMKARYDALVDPDGPYSGDQGFDHERAGLAALLPTMKQYADEEAAENDQQPAPTHPDPMARQIAEAIVADTGTANTDSTVENEGDGIAPEAKLAILKGLSDTGADIDDLRSEAIKDFHDEKMKGMSDDEKIDYVATLANQQKAQRNGYTIDPNVDYEAELGELLNDKAKKQNSKTARRLRDIDRKAGIYKTATYINRAMTELDEMEKAGLDVAETRDKLQKNLEAITNPNQQKIDAVADTVDDPELKIDLKFFGDKSTEDAVNEALEPIDGVAADILGAMGAPREIVTGFEDTVKGLSTANVFIDNEDSFRLYEDTLAGAMAAVSDLKEQIASVEADIDKLSGERDAARNKAFAIRSQYVTPENNERLSRIYKDMARVYKEGPVEAGRAARNSYQLEADLALGDPANAWTTEQRDEYEAELGRYNVLGRRMAEKKQLLKQLAADRDSTNEAAEPYKLALLGSTVANNATTNQSVFGPTSLQVNSDEQLASLHRQRRQKFNENANGVIKAAKDRIFGKSTVDTTKEIADAFSEVIDEKQLAQHEAIATALGRKVKELKTDLAVINLAKVYAAGDEAAFNAQFEKSFDAVMELSPQKEFTPQGKAKYERAQERARKRLNDYIQYLKDEYNLENDGEALYKVLDQQKLTIEAAIERAEQTAKNYYSLGAKGMYDAFSGNSGGHMPAEVIMTNYAILRKSIKKHNPIGVVTNVVDTFPRIVEKFMGENAPIFVSQFVQPVRDGEAMAARRFNELRDQYKWLEKTNKKVREQMSMARHYGWSEEQIRQKCGDDADTVINGVRTLANIFDTILPEINVAYTRNGIDPVKKRNNYIPLIQKEKNPVLRAMGIHASFEDIPTASFGETEGYTPVHEFFRFAMERKSDDLEGCELDPIVLLDTYLPSALTQIYQTDNIVRMRDMIDCINANADYSDLGKSTVGGLQNFRRYLTEYCNTVSGKKVGFLDRAVERTIGRRYFAWAKALTQIKGQSSTGANLNVVVANFEPITMCFGTNPTQTAKAIADTLHGAVSGTGKDLIGKSDFLTTRFSEKNHAYTGYQKMVQAMYKPAELTDRFCSEVVWRTGYYNACQRLGIDLDGDTDLHKKARINADNFAIKVMASKTRGEKAMMYNSATGSMFGQFLQESTNNLLFMRKDAGTYAGGNAKAIGRFDGTVKAIAAILMAMSGHELINWILGKDALPSVLGPGRTALNDYNENGDIGGALKTFGEEALNTLNPYDNIFNNDSGVPLIGGVPVVSSTAQTAKNVWSMIVAAAENGFNAANAALTDQEYTPNGFDFYGTMANTILGWAPGGTAAKRLLDTAKVTNQGYALSSKGRFKYTFEPTPGNIALSAAFGPDASIEGRGYTASGYKTQSDANTQAILDRIAAGQPVLSAYNAVVGDTKAKAAAQEATKAQRFGEDNTDLLVNSKELRQEQGQPKDLMPSLYGSINEPWMQKAIDMWIDTGMTTYPKRNFNIYEDAEHGSYIQSDGKNIPVDEVTLEEIDEYIVAETKYAVNRYGDDPEAVKKAVEKANKDAKKKYLGGE